MSSPARVAMPAVEDPVQQTALEQEVAALLVQAPGLVAEHWFFFAQARHPQNLYYQVVS